jgi:hypothetical protein
MSSEDFRAKTIRQDFFLRDEQIEAITLQQIEIFDNIANILDEQQLNLLTFDQISALTDSQISGLKQKSKNKRLVPAFVTPEQITRCEVAKLRNLFHSQSFAALRKSQVAALRPDHISFLINERNNSGEPILRRRFLSFLTDDQIASMEFQMLIDAMVLIADFESAGNLLAVTLSDERTLILVSGTESAHYRTVSNVNGLLQKASEENRARIYIKTIGEVMSEVSGGNCGAILDEIIASFTNCNGLADGRLIVEGNSGNVKVLLECFKRYIATLYASASETEVKRPIRGNSLFLPNSCVSDKRAASNALQHLSALINAMEHVPLSDEFSQRIGCFLTQIFKGLRTGEAVFNAATGNVPRLFEAAKYCENSLHTEAQLQAQLMNNHVKLSTSRFIFSQKLPCWSCARLPWLQDAGFKSRGLGINPIELPLYPATIRFRFNGQLFASNPAVNCTFLPDKRTPIFTWEHNCVDLKLFEKRQNTALK